MSYFREGWMMPYHLMFELDSISNFVLAFFLEKQLVLLRLSSKRVAKKGSRIFVFTKFKFKILNVKARMAIS